MNKGCGEKSGKLGKVNVDLGYPQKHEFCEDSGKVVVHIISFVFTDV